jgi:hypothetical protein
MKSESQFVIDGAIAPRMEEEQDDNMNPQYYDFESKCWFNRKQKHDQQNNQSNRYSYTNVPPSVFISFFPSKLASKKVIQ